MFFNIRLFGHYIKTMNLLWAQHKRPAATSKVVYKTSNSALCKTLSLYRLFYYFKYIMFCLMYISNNL